MDGTFGGGGGGGGLNKALNREPPPRGLYSPQTLALLYTVFERKGNPFINFPWKLVPLSYTILHPFSKLFTHEY